MTNWLQKKVLVTGGTRGIGYAVARSIVERGGTVTVVGTNAERAMEISDDLKGLAGQAYGLGETIDGQEATAIRIVQRAHMMMEGLTGLVNAAGGATVGHALSVPWDTWHQDWDVKFWGYFSLMRAAIDQMAEGGVIVNVLGVTGQDPNPRLAPASAINGALRGLTKILADDVAHLGIRVVAVNPGATATTLLEEMARGYARLDQITPEEALERLRQSGPLGRLPQPADVAAAVLFLLSDEAQMVTGTHLDVDGGAHRGPA